MLNKQNKAATVGAIAAEGEEALVSTLSCFHSTRLYCTCQEHVRASSAWPKGGRTPYAVAGGLPC